MFRSRKTFKWYGLIIAAAMSFVIALIGFSNFSILANVQEKTKRSISEMFYYPKTAISPVKFHKVKVRGKDVKLSTMFEEGNKHLEKALKPDEEFEEDDDFLESITFDVMNRSDRKITYMTVLVYIYTKNGVKNRSFDDAIAIDYGAYGAPLTSNSWVLNPGDSITVSIPERKIPRLRQSLERLGSPIIRVGIHTNKIAFEDGSIWNFDGKIHSPLITPKQSSLKNGDRRNMPSKPVKDWSYSPVIIGYSLNKQTAKTNCSGLAGAESILASFKSFGSEIVSSTWLDSLCPAGYCFYNNGVNEK